MIRQSVAAVFIIAAVFFTGCEKDKDPVSVSGVSLNKTTLTLPAGGSETLAAIVAPDNAENKAVTWQSDNTGIATVSNAGAVTAIKAGTAVITVTTIDGSFTARCTVTVSAAVTGIMLDKPALTLIVGASETLAAAFVPDDATDRTLVWTSSDETVATVADGVVTAVSAGTAVIVAATRDGGKTATCTVTVNTTMTLTSTRKGEVRIGLAGTGTAFINWDDGSDPEEVPLAVDYIYTHHAYSGTSARNITIDGQNITHVLCYNIQLTSLDVSKNTALTGLDCSSNRLTSLDVSKNTALTELRCHNNQLTSLDASRNTALTELRCEDNQLTSLDVSKNTALTELHCVANQLTSLNMDKNTALTNLYCGYNQLTSLDVSKNTALTRLDCFDNQLTSLDVSKNTALTELRCDDNQLTSLDVSKNTALTELICRENQFTAAGLNALFSTLHTDTEGGYRVIYINSNPGIDGCDRSIATQKGWYVY